MGFMHRIRRAQIIGMLRGVAIGDGLGGPVETYTFDRIERNFGRITTYIRNPAHKVSGLKHAGMWSDDTQLTLAVAEGIIETGSLDLEAQARWLLKLIDEFGDMGLGTSTRESVGRLRAGVSPWDSGKTPEPARGLGNGVPMKCSPVGPWMLWVINRGEGFTSEWLVEQIAAFTAMTHYTDVALQSALAHIWTLWVCLVFPPELVHADVLCNAAEYGTSLSDRANLPGADESLRTQLRRLRLPNLRTMTMAQLNETWGQNPFLVCDSLPMAYACFLRHPHSIEAIYDAVAAGGDTDTNASMAGALLGALNGPDVFPDHLVAGLAHRDRIDKTAERLCDRLGIEE